MYSQILGVISGIKEILILIIILIALIFLSKFVFKLKYGKYILAGIFSTVLIIFGVFTGFADYQYFTAHGGIFGSFDDIFNSSNKLYQDNLKFTFSEFNMISTGNPDEFSAKFLIENTNVSMMDKMIIANNCKSKTKAQSDNFIIAEYGYTFFDDNLKEIASDTLTINFVFNTKTIVDEKTGEVIKNDFSYCILLTKGGLKKAKLWNEFIKRNDFIIEIKTNDFVEELPEIDNLPEYTINFYLDENLQEDFSITYTALTKNNIIFPKTIKDKTILYWKDIDGNIVEPKDLNCTNLDLYAEYIKSITLSIYVNVDDSCDDTSSYGIMLLSPLDESGNVVKTNSYGLVKDRIFNFTHLLPGTYKLVVKTVLTVKSIEPVVFELVEGQNKTLTIPIFPSGYDGIVSVGGI